MKNGGTTKLSGRDWGFILTAAAVMLATLPGRTQGLSLITEPLIDDLKLDRLTFANINLWATLIGSLFCIPAGWLFDRFGLRGPTAAIISALAAVTWALTSSLAGGTIFLLILLTLTRGLGQSALSVASITAVGKRFGERAAIPMAIFSIALSVFFAIAFGAIGYSVRTAGWRTAWLQVATALIIFAPFTLILLHSQTSRGDQTEPASQEGFTLQQALCTPAFWVFAGAAALFNFVSSGFGLFNEAILAEHGFDRATFHMFLAVTTLLSLVGQFLGGWLMRAIAYRAVTAIALAIYAVGLILIPAISSKVPLFAISALIGVAAGMIIVVFFTVWAQVFGRAHLGRIQGAAQLLTVIASAAGPSVFAAAQARTGSYTSMLVAIAILVAITSVIALRTPAPVTQRQSSVSA